MQDEIGPRTVCFESDVVDADALRAALRRRERDGGTVALNLVLNGVIAPSDLARFLVEKTWFPRVADATLRELPPETIAALPPELIFDGAVLPIVPDDGTGRMVVAFADPRDAALLEDVSFFGACEVTPMVMSVDQLARFHPTLLNGHRWRVGEDDLLPSTDAISDEVKTALSQACQIEAEMVEAANAEEKILVIVVVGEDEGNTLTLTRGRRTAASTLERAQEPALTEAQRPRIARKQRGASRHFLDAPVEGEAVLVEHSRRVKEDDTQPSIIIAPELLESEDKPKEPSNVFIDPSLLSPASTSQPDDNGEETSEDKHAPRPSIGHVEVRLGVSTGVAPVIDPDDEWSVLSEGMSSLQEGIEDIDWPFGEASGIFMVPDIDDDIPITEEAPEGPMVGESSITPTRRSDLTVEWFTPEHEKGSAVGVSDDLRLAMQEMRTGADARTTLLAVSRALTDVYERACVMHVTPDSAVVVAYSTPRTGLKWAADREQDIQVDVGALPVLLQLTDDPMRCFHGVLPRPAVSLLETPLAGGPALNGVIAPIAMGGRVLLLLYADAGPGRECERHPELWRLLRRQLPTALLRTILMRKRHTRWMVG